MFVMLLAIDIGNTNIVFGLFKGKKLIKKWRTPTPPTPLPLGEGGVFGVGRVRADQVLIASVVPSLDRKISKEIFKRFKVRPHFVTAGNIPKLRVRLKNKREIGADRVVNALAVYELYGGPAIIVDFGTATTFDAISGGGEYLGGAIAPGIMLARDALYEQTAKLPRVKIEAPRSVIGSGTLEAMRSGLVYGYVAMVEGMVERIKVKIQKAKVKIKVIATGGLAPLICKHTRVIDRIDPELTLKGLRIIANDVRRAK